MNIPCSNQKHEGKPVMMVCANLECKSKHRLMCLRCLLDEHKQCYDDVLEIENILKGDILKNLNWLKHEEIKTAIELIHKHNLSSQVQVLETSAKRVEEEFAKIKEDFCKKVDNAKEKVLKNLKARESVDYQINLKTFTKRMEEFYGFDTLTSIIQSVQDSRQNDVETVNIVLDSFFTSLKDKKKGVDLELENKSKDLGKYLKSVVELDTALFERARKSVNLSFFDHYLKDAAEWTWNYQNKAAGIQLSDDGLYAEKTTEAGYHALGTVELSRGVHRWELDIASANGNAYWIAFGIIEKSIADGVSVNGFNYCSTFGLSTDSAMYQMTLNKGPHGWDNKTYTCELDLDKGVFSIYADDHLVCRNKTNIKDNTFLPYIYLWTAGDRATLRVL